MRLFIPVVILFCGVSGLSAQKPDFATDVQPILKQACFSCHGPGKQQGGLRLDRKANALKGGNDGVVFVPGKSAESLLFKRITSTDPTERMPPKGPPLRTTEIAAIKAWIDSGMAWKDDAAVETAETWWSLKPISKPAIPKLNDSDTKRVRTPVDAFILANLREMKLPPSPEADRRTLIRRVTFDLTGLPPTPTEVDAFVADNDPKAYEKLVERLLSTTAYGERWARHWLDVVHYGDSHGYDKDKPRPNAWPYRDYVIKSFNADKPYTRFVKEQLAGDVFFPGTPDGIEALGFIAAGPWDFIGHAELPESKIDGKIARHLDRDDMVANTIGTFMGLTAHCAQCHNHKFDPISQEDYYRLQAVFAAVDRADKFYDADPAVAKRRQELETQRATLIAQIDGIRNSVKANPRIRELEEKLALAAKPPGAKQPEFGYHSGLEAKQDIVKWVQVDLGERKAISGIALTGCHDEFNNIGAGFGFPVRFKIEVSDDPTFKVSTIVVDRTMQDVPNPGISPVRAKVEVTGRYVRVTATKLALRQNDYILALAELEVTDTSGKNLALNKPVTSLDSIEALPRWSRKNLTDGIAYRTANAGKEDVEQLKRDLDAAWETAAGPERWKSLRDLESRHTTLKQTIAKLPPQQTAYVGSVYKGGGAFVGTGNSGGKPRPIHLLSRGDVTKPGKLVEPGGIRGIPGPNAAFSLPADHREADRRAALANWITDPKNPLTWRVIANRVWLYHFDRGIVDSPNDFGRMGQLPSHPELLDWLAAEFRDGGQSIKHLHRLIVNSSTYRQSSAIIPETTKVDASNVYLSRMNRRRLEAEAVRDSLLAVAGKLNPTPYGPGFQDFVIDKPEHSPHYEYQKHDPNDPKSHRRSVYRFIVRSQSQPFMAALDCADPSLFVDKRNNGVSPLQALAMMNNPLSVAMARQFADRVTKDEPDPAKRIDLAYRLAFGRLPTSDERTAMTDYTTQHGLANACRLIFNLNEFLFVD